MPERSHSRAPTSYIVRVYRREQVSRKIAGVVENPEFEERAPFASFDELKAILLRPSGRVAPAARVKQPRAKRPPG